MANCIDTNEALALSLGLCFSKGGQSMDGAINGCMAMPVGTFVCQAGAMWRVCP